MKAPKFKGLWLRMKGKVVGMGHDNLATLDELNLAHVAPKKARKMVKEIDMLLVPTWNLQEIFLVDQIR